jgi:hypothetical protein
MTQLSPEAQAVLDAFSNEPTSNTDGSLNVSGAIAAALRAAAEQLGYNIIYDDDEQDYMVDVADLLAIAAELEAQ